MAVVGVRGIVFTGHRAVVRLGYQRAALLGAWTVEGGVITAAIEDCDGFRITQTPLTLEIPNADGIPTYRALTDVTARGGQLTARLVKQ